MSSVNLRLETNDENVLRPLLVMLDSLELSSVEAEITHDDMVITVTKSRSAEHLVVERRGKPGLMQFVTYCENCRALLWSDMREVTSGKSHKC